MRSVQRSIQTNFFRYKILLPLLVFFITLTCTAQDKAPVNFGKIKAEDFNISSELIDSNTNAVIVFDKGDISFEGNKTGWFSYIFKRSRRIKVINKKGFDMATVELLLYKNEDSKETVEKLSGITYNIENGAVIESKLNDKDIFEEKTDKNHFSKKFTMPGVKEGSVIEYSYTIKSDFEFNLPEWDFQSTVGPTLWSEYNVAIPGLLHYMNFWQGYHKFATEKSGEGFKTYSIIGKKALDSYINRDESITVSSLTATHQWVMKDVPVFYVENYICSPVNFIDKISFQLYKTYDGEDFHDVFSTWGKVTEQLMKREDFGKYLNDENGWLDKILNQVVNEHDGTLEAAKKIYYHVQKNYTCTNSYNKYIKTSLEDVVKKKSGTVGDINLLLIAMLNRKNIQALPVLLSTREFGRNPKDYPLMERLNYVIGKVKINSTDYYLDATTPFLAFGKLPSKCYNGNARVISNDTTALYFDPDLLTEINVVSIFITNNEKNEVEGNYTSNMGFFESLETKNKIAASGLNEYKTNLKQSFPEEMQISNIQVDSFQQAEEPVSVKLDFKLSSFENADIVYFNPLMGEAIKKNPFYAAERMYPVEMPFATDNVYVLNMEIPKGYKIDELPKSVHINLNENEGVFEYLISADVNAIQMRCRILLKKANFAGEDYRTLRDFYTFIVKKEAEQIVFKKIK